MSFYVNPRKSWFASPVGYIPLAKPPLKHVMVTYTRKDYSTGTKNSPGPRPRKTEVIDELLHIQKGDKKRLADIRYNFMVGGDGEVYEGRGWLSVPTFPLRLQKMSFEAYFIAFIGDFNDCAPHKSTFTALDDLIKYGVKNKFISPKMTLWFLVLPRTFKQPFTEYIPL